MGILYVARKKVYRIAGQLKTMYYAIPKALQKKSIREKQLAEEMSFTSSLTPGDVMSVLVQLPHHIVNHLRQGRTVTIEGLGTYYLAISSEGVETPEECKPSTIKSFRICFKPDKRMSRLLHGVSFQRIPDNDNK